MINAHKFNIVLIATILLLSTTLLVGRQLDLLWAGGTGPAVSLEATTGSIVHPRGSVVRSDEEYKILKIGSNTIFMDSRTEILLNNLHEDNLVIQLIQGHAVVHGSLEVTTRDTTIETLGLLSITHYSWLDKIDVAILDGSATITTPEYQKTLDTRALSFSTLPPYTAESQPFKLDADAKVEFYDWVQISR